MKEIYPWQTNDWLRLQELSRRPAHGLLFRGSKGIGKLDLAVTFAQSLLCQQPDGSGFACGVCPSCHWFEQGTHPDYRLLQPESLSLDGEENETGKKPSKQISIDQIRGLADFFGMTSHQGGKRLIIIHPAESMNSNAANALLKSLEEPPPGLLFILVSHKPQRLLPTIISRCLSVALSAPNANNATQWLMEQGVKDPADALAASGFSPLLAVQSDEMLGSEERDRLLRAMRQPAGLDVFALAEGLQRTEQVLVVQWLQQWCYDLSSMKLSGRLRYHPGEAAVIKGLVESVTPLNLARLQKLLQTAKRQAQHTLNPRLFFESLFLVYRQLMLER
jgi:DNA polymerase III subunit delta'